MTTEIGTKPPERRRLCMRLSRGLAIGLAGCAARKPWILAVLLLVPIGLLEDLRPFGLQRYGSVWFACLRWAAIFSVGALQRGRWRDLLGMATLGCAGCAALRAIPRADESWAWQALQSISRDTAFIALAGLGELVATARKSRGSLAGLLALALGAGALHALVGHFAFHCRGTVELPLSIPWGHDWPGPGYGLEVIDWPLLAALTWIAISLSSTFARPDRRRVVVTCSGVSICVLAYASYMVLAVPKVAAFSVEHDFPFRRDGSIALLHSRDYPGLAELLWPVLENDEWRWIDGSRWIGNAIPWNWRQFAIYALAKRDREETAARLSELLRRRPRLELAREARDLLVETRRYECAPLLFRYALSSSVDELGDDWTEKLVQMRFPQAAELIFYDAIRWANISRGSDILEFLAPRTNWDWVQGGGGTTLSEEQRHELTGLLRQDAGERLADWMILYADTIDIVETPLSHEQHLEAQRTSDCFVSYLRGLRLWRRVEYHRLRQQALDRLRAESPEDAAQIEVLDKNVLRARSLELFNEDSRLVRALSRFHRHFDEARSKVEVPSPNWDVLTIDELEREIAQYLRTGIAAAEEELYQSPSDPGEGE